MGFVCTYIFLFRQNSQNLEKQKNIYKLCKGLGPVKTLLFPSSKTFSPPSYVYILDPLNAALPLRSSGFGSKTLGFFKLLWVEGWWIPAGEEDDEALA